MRQTSQSNDFIGRAMRLTFVIVSFMAAFFVAKEALAFVGFSSIESNAGGLVVALAAVALAMYG